MNGTGRQSTLREWQALTASPRLWVTFAIVVSLFTLTGPFGTLEALNAWMRFGYWLALHAMAWTTAIAFSLVAEHRLARWIPSSLARMALGSGLAALPIALEVELLNRLSLAPGETGHFLSTLLVTLPLSLLFCLLTYMTLSREEEAAAIRHAPALEEAPVPSPAQPLPADPPAAVPLMKRLRIENRGRLIRLEAEDHYTRVVTTAGSELLLLRFADALDELGQAPGLRIHRSHWIATDQVRAIRRDGGRVSLVSADGTLLPVSRAKAQALKDELQTLSPAAETGAERG